MQDDPHRYEVGVAKATKRLMLQARQLLEPPMPNSLRVSAMVSVADARHSAASGAARLSVEAP